MPQQRHPTAGNTTTITDDNITPHTPLQRHIITYYSFISTNHSHSLFRRKQNVQNISLKRVEDISKRYLLILYIIVRYVHASNFNYMIIKQHLRLFSKVCL